MAKSMIILIVALVALQQLIACQAAELGEQKKEGAATDADKTLVPVVIMKQGEGKEDKPDFFLIWISSWEPFLPEQIKDMINSQVRPQTQQISQQISNIPGANQAYQMISQAQEAMSGAIGGSGGSNPLSGMLGRRR